MSSCSGLPVRTLGSQAQLDEFLKSDTFQGFVQFIDSLGHSVRGIPISQLPPVGSLSMNVRWAARLLDGMCSNIDDYPPTPQTTRFGNSAFREWLDFQRRTVPLEHHTHGIQLADQVSSYLLNALGDHQRIDYGTGHEAHFAAWLFCLCHPSTGPVFQPSDHSALVLILFERYLRLARRLQATYWLEPAGSHGVWGLDDYHFLPFLWGAAQLSEHKHIKPKTIHDMEIVDELASDYLYLNCIANINRVKHNASLRWHSPLLDDISAVKSWSKVYTGLMKMYRAEVLGKLPIMQHFLFGTILPFTPTVSAGDEGEMSGVKRHNLQGDCCGNPLPSIYAAAAADQRDPDACRHVPLRGLPFD